MGSRLVKIVNGEEELGVSVINNDFSTREEVPPIRLFLGKKRTGDWASQSAHPEAPGRGLAGGRWSGLTPPKKLLVVEGRGEVVKPSEEELGGVGGAKGGTHAPEESNFFPRR